MNQETAMLHAVWRKAIQSDEPVRLPCPTKSDASKLRWALYNAVSKYRPGGTKHGQADDVLLNAIENCSLSVEGPKDGPCTVIVQQKAQTKVMQIVAAALGATPAVEAVDAAAAESQERLMKRLQEDASLTEPRVTPFYTRDRD